MSTPGAAAVMPPADIKALRKRLGLSQDEAGRLVGGSTADRARGTWNAWEAGRRNPSGAALAILMLLDKHSEVLGWLRDIRCGGEA